MNKASKNKAVLFNVTKIIVILLVTYLCFTQFKKLDFNQAIILSKQSLLLIIPALLLVLPNYYLEYKKWQITLNQTGTVLTIQSRIQSFFAGIITGMITPNMQGNFIGRIYYAPRHKRIQLTLLTLVGNLGQFITTILMGLVALIILEKISILNILPIVLLLLCLIIYFTLEYYPFLFKRFPWYERMITYLKAAPFFRWKILLLSFLRGLVFSVQFLLVLIAFGAPFSVLTYLLIWKMYLISTISPSLFLGKLFIRESIALWTFACLQLPDWNILLASFTIWCINLLLPTIAGLIICKRAS